MGKSLAWVGTNPQQYSQAITPHTPSTALIQHLSPDTYRHQPSDSTQHLSHITYHISPVTHHHHTAITYYHQPTTTITFSPLGGGEGPPDGRGSPPLPGSPFLLSGSPGSQGSPAPRLPGSPAPRLPGSPAPRPQGSQGSQGAPLGHFFTGEGARINPQSTQPHNPTAEPLSPI